LQRILRTLCALTALLVACTALVACGGGDGGGGGDGASADTDVNTLLDKTFSGDKKVEKGKIDLSLNVDVSGDQSVSGPISVRLSGPFETQGDQKLPKFALSVEAQGQGQNIKAGATSTGDKGFVSFNGQDYALSDQVFQQFKDGYEQAQQQAAKNNGKQPTLASLGLNPREWLTDPKNAGEGKVGDTDVIRITAGLDMSKFLDDVNKALEQVGSLGVSSSQVPSKITPEQKQQVMDAVQDVQVEIDTGKDDTILRRMKVDLTAKDTTGGSNGSAKVSFDLQLLDLGESQDFPEPSNPKPFDQLLSQLGGLGGLGALGGGTGSSSSGSGSSSGSSGSGASSQENLQKYSKCLEDAGQDLDKAQKCADLLAP
jgi:hypothetical protein